MRSIFCRKIKHFLIAANATVALSASPALAQGMVLVMEEDGSLRPSTPQTRFARNYNDGIGQGAPSNKILLFGAQREDDASRATTTTRPSATPSPKILNAIEQTALRYASHPALRRANLSVIEWQLLYQANIEIESAYNPNALSSAGAIGLGQLMPDTARHLGVDPNNWQENLDGSARYLLMMLARFGNARLALAAYNAGPDAVDLHNGIPPFKETQNHVSLVLAAFNRLEGELSS